MQACARRAPRPAAAALAVEALYFGDPDLPAQPDAAYPDLLHVVPGTFARVTNKAALADGTLACTDFSKREGVKAVAGSFGPRHLSYFQSYVVSEFATEYLCPAQLSHALPDLRRIFVGSSSP